MNNFQIVMKYEIAMDNSAIDSNLYFVSDEEREQSLKKNIAVKKV